MTVDSFAEASISAASNTVNNAALGFLHRQSPSPSGKELTAALLILEKAAKRTRQEIPLSALLGTWRLCFSAGKNAKFQSGQPKGSGFYIPKLAIAQITFSADETAASLSITNELKVGPLQVRFTGPARYLGKKNILAFDFTHLTIRGFGIPLYQGAVNHQKRAGQSFAETAIGQLPFFAFFSATDDYIAARGRGGGLAIWVRPQQSSPE